MDRRGWFACLYAFDRTFSVLIDLKWNSAFHSSCSIGSSTFQNTEFIEISGLFCVFLRLIQLSRISNAPVQFAYKFISLKWVQCKQMIVCFLGEMNVFGRDYLPICGPPYACTCIVCGQSVCVCAVTVLNTETSCND